MVGKNTFIRTEIIINRMFTAQIDVETTQLPLLPLRQVLCSHQHICTHTKKKVSKEIKCMITSSCAGMGIFIHSKMLLIQGFLKEEVGGGVGGGVGGESGRREWEEGVGGERG